MYKVVIVSHHDTTKKFNTIEEVNACATRLLKAYRSFDVYKDGKLIATSDGHTIYNIPKKKSVVRGSVGYAEMMSERR